MISVHIMSVTVLYSGGRFFGTQCIAQIACKIIKSVAHLRAPRVFHADSINFTGGRFFVICIHLHKLRYSFCDCIKPALSGGGRLINERDKKMRVKLLKKKRILYLHCVPKNM